MKYFLVGSPNSGKPGGHTAKGLPWELKNHRKENLIESTGEGNIKKKKKKLLRELLQKSPSLRKQDSGEKKTLGPQQGTPNSNDIRERLGK